MGDGDQFISGALPDLRSAEQKDRDYTLREIVAELSPVRWEEKAPSTWRKFPVFNQDGSGSCVAQTLAKLLGILYWLKNQTYVHFSATHIYRRRSNRPSGGMSGVEAFEIAKSGVTLEELVPSQGMNDAQMDAVDIPGYKEKVGEVFRSSNYVMLPLRSIDAVASVIQATGKGVMVWLFFEFREWTDVPTVLNPDLGLTSSGVCRHSVAAVDFTLWKGEKALVVDESWGKNISMFDGQRVITEKFFNSRNWFAAYPIDFKFADQSAPSPDPLPQPARPSHRFTKVLAIGTTDPDVAALQDILKYEGMFPTNVASTGYYGAITARGVRLWQTRHAVASAAEIAAVDGRRVGDKTIEKLNQSYP